MKVPMTIIFMMDLAVIHIQARMGNSPMHQMQYHRVRLPRRKLSMKPSFQMGGFITSFFQWLQKKKGNAGKFVPFCSICKVDITMGKSAIMRHKESKTHLQASKISDDLAKSQPGIQTFFQSSSDEILKHATLGKQKATNTIRQVLGFHYMIEGVEQLKGHKFSLTIDETMDKSTKSQMAVIGTYFDAESFKNELYLLISSIYRMERQIPSTMQLFSICRKNIFQWRLSLYFVLTPAMLCLKSIIQFLSCFVSITPGSCQSNALVI
ncbi:uncharacterized protein LOC116972569 [Amblyraja radiata]|uniref:uncharacterized protein LOC116972569 n=1 Tax=Amblyraja radiata TaxID=386614 RepID=UPI0014036786|nr:uncharacterized protein LOC116972569 [Amblyraja radiata]